jgi:hypothetical protein
MSQRNESLEKADEPRSSLRRAGAVGSATVLAGGSAFGVLAALAGPSGAATFTVTEATDDGTGTTPNTLSWAIEQANADPDADVIDFAPGLTTVTFSDSAEQVPITETVSITGPGSDALAIDFAGNCGLLLSSDTASLTVSGLTLRNGSTYGTSDNCDNRGNASGGALAIYSDTGGDPGTFLIDDVVFTNNYAYYYGGGLIVKGGASVTIQDSVFADNDVFYGGSGGAYIDDTGDLDILRTTFFANVAPEAGALEVNIQTGSTARIVDSTFLDNYTTDGNGGAIIFENGSAELVNSTVSGNSSTRNGGGFESDIPLTVIQSTITGNYANNRGGGAYIRQGDFGGGEYAAFEIVMSTISGNEAGSSGSELFIDRINSQPRSSSIVGSIVAGPYSDSMVSTGSTPATDFPVNVSNSLIGTSSDVPWVDGGGNTFDVADPGLEALADNGGPTPTMALSAGSPAIDAGPDPVPWFPENSYDQRGEPYVRVYGAGVDIGALESQPEPEPTTTTTSPEPTTSTSSPDPTTSTTGPNPTTPSTPTTAGGGSESASGGLPATGASVAPLVAAGTALVTSGGAAAALAARRRRGPASPGDVQSSDET